MHIYLRSSCLNKQNLTFNQAALFINSSNNINNNLNFHNNYYIFTSILVLTEQHTSHSLLSFEHSENLVTTDQTKWHVAPHSLKPPPAPPLVLAWWRRVARLQPQLACAAEDSAVDPLLVVPASLAVAPVVVTCWDFTRMMPLGSRSLPRLSSSWASVSSASSPLFTSSASSTAIDRVPEPESCWVRILSFRSHFSDHYFDDNLTTCHVIFSSCRAVPCLFFFSSLIFWVFSFVFVDLESWRIDWIGCYVF